jgi:hypothetical protein
MKKFTRANKLFTIFTGKKALGEMVTWVIRCMLLIPIVFLMAVYANSFIVNNLDTTTVENELLVQRFLYSPDGFTYIDSDTLRVYPGYIDMKKFNSTYAEQALKFSDTFFSAKFTLTFDDGHVNETYYDKISYDKYKQYVGITGMVDGYTKYYPVKVYDNGVFSDAILKIDAVMARG